MKRVKLKTSYTSNYLRHNISYNIWGESDNTYALMDKDGSIMWHNKGIFDIVDDISINNELDELEKENIRLRAEIENFKNKKSICVKKIRCNECAGIVLSVYKTIYNTYVCENCIKKFNIISD
jgi:hypothetical protein